MTQDEVVKNPELESVKAAVKVVDQQPSPPTVTLANGVVIRCKPVSVMTLRYASTSVPRPKPPVIRNKDKDRDEEWEGDPAYQQALMDWENKVGDTGTNVMLLLGTEIESVPDNVEKVGDDGWVELLQATGMDVNVSSEPARYLSWLRFYAITTPQDLLMITANIAEKSGVLDKDVQASLESFRGGADGGTDLENKTEELNTDGDSVQSTNGRSHLRTGGEG